MRVAREAWFFGGSACKLYGFRELSPAACDFQNHPHPGSKFRKLAAPLAGPGWNPCLGCHWTLSGLKRYTALERGAGKTAPWGEVLVTNPDDLSSIPITHVVDRDNWLPRAVLGPLCERRTVARVPPLPLHTHTKEERKEEWIGDLSPRRVVVSRCPTTMANSGKGPWEKQALRGQTHHGWVHWPCVSDGGHQEDWRRHHFIDVAVT